MAICDHKLRWNAALKRLAALNDTWGQLAERVRCKALSRRKATVILQRRFDQTLYLHTVFYLLHEYRHLHCHSLLYLQRHM